MLWILFGLMSAAAILAVLWPLTRKPRADAAGSDLVVYRDQLEEIGRDHSSGLIGNVEAEAARVEVSRRLLAAADAQVPPPKLQPLWHRRTAAVVTLAVLALVPVGLYAALGSPDIPDQPSYARTELPPNHETIAALISRVEEHLAQDPNDGAGWQVIAPVYMRLGRYDESVMAFRKSLALNGETAERDSDLGEALVAAANGVVTVEAKGLFQRAVAHDPHDPKAGYFLGLADEQDGNHDAAAVQWRTLLKDAPANAPWTGFVRAALARVTSPPATNAGPTAQQMASAANMPEAQRTAMIRGMVQKLADKLHADGSDVNGWVRLVRAYVVLGDQEKAKGAVADAKRALAGHPEAVKRIDHLVKSLGIEG
ncbi:MAG: c-type cytochrome biogenesis protein CcmI [Xanthobacteraceae bacterium]